ncbi:MAG: Rossmann-like and DUF2520 domain-containing protein [Bacillota bacterium]
MKNICIIGAGKVAYSLTKALIDAKYNIGCIYSRRIESAEKLAGRFGIRTFTSEISEIPGSPAIYFLTVPDGEIKNAAESLSKARLNFRESLFVHLSGAQDISLLKSLEEKKASVASFHIMQTFPSDETVELKDHYAAVETNQDTAENILNEVASDLQLKAFRISSDKKVFYHLTGVWASNFIVANLYNALTAFENACISEVTFQDISVPIIESTLSNIAKDGIAGALSGPAARGEVETIKKHIDALSSSGGNLLLSYISNSLTLLNMLKKTRGELTDQQSEILAYLKEKAAAH